MVNSKVWTDDEKMLRDLLFDLKENYGCVSLKTSTEDAGMSYHELREVYRLFSDIFPIAVKIGGPEARNDIHNVDTMGINVIIAPMIESPYSLKKFIMSLEGVLSPVRFKHMHKHINIETITSVNQFTEIVNSEYMSYISQVTIGRGDLSMSMEKQVDSAEVMEKTKFVVDMCKKKDITVSVGGRVTPQNAALLASTVAPDKINTREVGFELNKVKDIKKTAEKVLEFEKELLEYKKKIFDFEIKVLCDRIKKINDRKNDI